jgi:hypothetical protein
MVPKFPHHLVTEAPCCTPMIISIAGRDVSVLVSVFAHIFVPLIALVAVAVIQFDKSIPMPVQIAEGGTDLCILAMGATGSMFISPKLHEKFGPEWMVLISIMIVLGTITLAGVSIHVNRSQMALRDRAKVNCFLGAAAIILVCGVVIVGAR